MITIPLSSNCGIRIPAIVMQAEPKHKQTDNVERISVSVQEAAKMLGISKPHFLPLIQEGKVRTVKIGRRILVSVQSLREFIDGKKELSHSIEKNTELQGAEKN